MGCETIGAPLAAAACPFRCMYHQPPPAASSTVAAIAPIHNPFLPPPLAGPSVCASSPAPNKFELNFGACGSLSIAMGSGSVLLPKLYDSPATCASSDEGASRAAIVNGNATTFALARGCDSGTGTLDTTGTAACVVDGAGVTEGEEKDGVAALRASSSSHAGIFTSSSCSPLTPFSVFAFNVASCDETGFC